MTKLRQQVAALAACALFLVNSLPGLAEDAPGTSSRGPSHSSWMYHAEAPSPGGTGSGGGGGTPGGSSAWSGGASGAWGAGSGSTPGGQARNWQGASDAARANWYQQRVQNGLASPPRSMDLSSTVRSISAGNLRGMQSVNLQVGQNTVAVTPGTLLTPAEKVAVSQILRTGAQSLHLNEAGGAVGGSFMLRGGFSRAINDLVIPQGVTAIQNAGRGANLNVLGNLNNSGNLYIFSTNPQVTAASVIASNIFNNMSGLISTQLPTGFTFRGDSPIAGLNLRLAAVNDIVNAGTISSAGNLSLRAGGSIINALPAGVSGPSPVIQAANNLRLFSSSGNITNSGLIAATAGNINIASLAASNINILNNGGRFSAPAGSINLRSPDFAGKVNLTLTGGDFISKEINAYNGDGITRLSVESISGTLNITSGEAHTQVTTGQLTLGNLILTGDPDFYDPSGAPIVLTGTIQISGQPLAIISAGDILTSGSVVIDTSSSSGNGGSLLLIAGADFRTCNGGACTGSQLPPVTGNDTLVLKGFKLAGEIDLSGATVIDASGGGATGNSGNISMYAPGRIHIPTTTTINANGSSTCTGTCTGGNVTIQGGRNAGNAITTGNINAIGTGGAGATGDSGGFIVLSASKSELFPGDLTITNGAITDGFIIEGVESTGSIVAGILNASSTGNTNAGGVTITGAGKVTVDQLIAAAPGTGKGGGILVIADELRVTGADVNGVSINASSALGDGLRGNIFGAVTIETKSAQPMHIFQNAVQPPPVPLPVNYIAGIVLASGGVLGGDITFQSNSTARPIVNVDAQFPEEGDVLNRRGVPFPQNNGRLVFLNANFEPESPRIERRRDPINPNSLLASLAGRGGSNLGAQNGLTGSAIATDVTQGAPGGDDPADLPDVGDDEGILSGDEAGPGTISGAVIRTNIDVANITGHGFVAKADTQKDLLEFDNGNMLVIPEHDLLVKTPESTIQVGAKSVAFIIKTKDRLAIYDLHHGKHGGIKIIASNKQMTLLPGKELVITDQVESDFGKINPATKIAFRKPSKEDFGENTKVYVAEFSIPSALMMIRPLQKLLYSKEPYERKTYYQLLKNAAILADVTASGGEYSTGAERSQ